MRGGASGGGGGGGVWAETLKIERLTILANQRNAPPRRRDVRRS